MQFRRLSKSYLLYQFTMKSIVLLSSVGFGLVAAAPQGHSHSGPQSQPTPPGLTKDTVPGLSVVQKPMYPQLFDKNGKLQSVFSNPPGVSLPKSLVPEVQTEAPKVFKDTIRKKIRHGPYRLPPTSEDNWQKREMKLAGMADNYHYNITKPCKECIIASLTADLEYADGSRVPNPSAWLHHSAVVNAGPKIRDPVCGESNTETLFSAGNERTVTRFYNPTLPVKAGYRLHEEDVLTIVGEYKNEIDKEQWVWLTLTWELFDGKQPTFKDSHVVWMSTIASLNCAKYKNQPHPFGEANVTAAGHPKPGKLTFTEHSVPWESPINGTVLGMGGHLHDGATSIDLFMNGKRVCEAKATYSNGPGGMGSNQSGGEHISSISSCPLGTPLKVNDKFWLAAHYDFTKHQGSLTTTGELDEIMGIGVITLIT
jgi:hypothetical protein